MSETTRHYYPVSWEQLHRDAKALAWRLAEKGPFQGIVAITRGGLVPAHIIARELDVLQDRLLGLFAADDVPAPHEILVVTPDLDAAAPPASRPGRQFAVVAAVFRARFALIPGAFRST